jgi:hypothetical protein
MPALGKLWAGRIFGTNTGNFFLDVNSSEEGALTGTLRLMDTLFGLAVYAVAGTFDGTSVILRGDPAPAKEPRAANLGTIEATGNLTADGNIRGTWSSSLGTGGAFEAYPHGQAAANRPTPGPQPTGITNPVTEPPEQLFLSNIAVGALRIYQVDLWPLVEFIRSDFLVGRPVITYAVRENEVSKYLDDFRAEAATLGQLRRFKLTIQEPEAHGINKVVVLDLNAFGRNELRVQGINESWVTGKSQVISRMLLKFENRLLSVYKKYGLMFNSLLFFGMLVVIPALQSMKQRAIFVAAIVVILFCLFKVHQRFIPNAVLYLSGEHPKWFQRVWPSILSWISALTAALAAALIFWWLTR